MIRPIFYLCFIALLCLSMIYAVSLMPFKYIDLTANQMHTLPATTQQMLKSSDPIEVHLVSQNLDTIRDLKFIIDTWMQINPKITWKVQQTPLPPEEAEKYHFAMEGMLLKMHQKVVALPLNTTTKLEPSLSKALSQLYYTQKHWVVFLTGHGEPDPLGDEPTDYGDFAKALQSQGMRVQPLNLTQWQVIADNTSLLILTNPKTEWLPKEKVLLEDYIQKGGSILWLMDFKAHPLPVLPDLLQIKALPGIIVDKHGQSLGSQHPALTLITDYHDELPFYQSSLTVFPWAQALDIQAPNAFNVTPLLTTHPQTWTEKGPLNGQIRFEPEKGEKSGPLLLSARFERNVQGKTQKIIVIGNHRFLTNAVIQNYGNKAFALNMTHWLLNEMALAKTIHPEQKDIVALIPQGYAWVIQWGFPIGIPLIMLFIGTGMHARFRKTAHG